MALNWFGKRPAIWHTTPAAARSSKHSTGPEFMLTLLTSPFTPSPIFPQSSPMTRIACLLGSSCSCTLTTFGSVTIPRRPPPEAEHMLFPRVLELFAEFWLLLMVLCGCLGPMLPVCLLMTASPTRSSHLFILAAFPSLCSLF